MKKKALPFILVSLLIMGMIFFFSSQTGDRSSSLSSHFAMIFYPLFGEEGAQFFVRKAAHFTIYFVLGMNVYLSFRFSGHSKKKAFFCSILVCFFYASFDEWHQAWVEARSGQFKDVLLDSSGSILAALLLSKYK